MAHSNIPADTMAVAPLPERLSNGQKVLIITADKTEDQEFFYPYYRLTEAGYTVHVATPNGGEFKAKNGAGLKDTLSINNVQPNDYALVYIPGGKAPLELRENQQVLNFVKSFAQSGKPIAAICHGPQVLAAADLIKGKRIAAWPEIENEITAAGATFVNEALVEDGQFITGRMPGDLHRHLFGVINVLAGKSKDQRVAA